MISCRSTIDFLGCRGAARLVIAGAVGGRFDRERQSRRRRHRTRRCRIALPGQNVEHDVAPAQLGRQRLGACCFDGIEPSLGDCRQDIDELPIAVAVAGEPAADLRQGRRQIPVAERVAIPERAPSIWEGLGGLTPVG